MSKQLTHFYFDGSQWKIDIPGHLIVNCNSYVHALNKWKTMRPNVNDSGWYETPAVQTKSPTNTGDLTKDET